VFALEVALQRKPSPRFGEAYLFLCPQAQASLALFVQKMHANAKVLGSGDWIDFLGWRLGNRPWGWLSSKAVLATPGCGFFWFNPRTSSVLSHKKSR
jgi:hypothetical protein